MNTTYFFSIVGFSQFHAQCISSRNFCSFIYGSTNDLCPQFYTKTLHAAGRLARQLLTMTDAVKSLDTINGVVGSLGPLEGAMFLNDVSRSAIFHLECTNPFKKMKVFDLSKVNRKPLTVEQVPLGYRPYSGCLFVRYYQ